jgi:hypothetical protein
MGAEEGRVSTGLELLDLAHFSLVGAQHALELIRPAHELARETSP